MSVNSSGLNSSLALLNSLLESAHKMDASRIHFYVETRSNSCLFEIAGKLQPTGKRLNNNVIKELVDYIKSLANLETSDLSLIQTADLMLKSSKNLKATLFSTPEFNKSHLILYLDVSAKPVQLDELGLWGNSLEQFESALDRRKGIILLDSTDQHAIRVLVDSALTYINKSQSFTSVCFDSSLAPSNTSSISDRIYTPISEKTQSLAKRVLSTTPKIVIFLDNLNETILDLAIDQADHGSLVFIITSTGTVAGALSKVISLKREGIQDISLAVSISPIQTIGASNGMHPLNTDTITQIEGFFEIDHNLDWRSVYAHAGIKNPEELLRLNFPVASEYGGVTNLVESFIPNEDTIRIISRNPNLSLSTLQSIIVRSGMLTKKVDGLIKALRKDVDLADVINSCK